MKYLIKTFREGYSCFLFTPALMVLLHLLILMGYVVESTQLHPAILSMIKWRYSSDGFFLLFFVCVLFCSLSMVITKTQNIPVGERNRISRVYNFVAIILSKTFLFWAGVCFAFTYGSFFVSFIPRIPGQELMVIFFIFVAVVCRFGTLQVKHYVTRKS